MTIGLASLCITMLWLCIMVGAFIGPSLALAARAASDGVSRRTKRRIVATACVAVTLTGAIVEARAARHHAPAVVTGLAVAPYRTRIFDVVPDSAIADVNLRAAVQRGRAILEATRDSLPGYVGNSLRCTSCHLDAGLRAGAMPWVGVYARFPQYRAREGRVLTLQNRINGCLRRSMNGHALPEDSRDMRDMVAYMAHVSRGAVVGEAGAGQSLKLRAPAQPPDADHGRALFATDCARCHGTNGEGMAVGTPLWGLSSFNIGAGMARLRTAAAFIQGTMPYDKPGTLGMRDALDVAAYVVAQPRPAFRGKEHDWPNGDAPADVAYRTLAGRKR